MFSLQEIVPEIAFANMVNIFTLLSCYRQKILPWSKTETNLTAFSSITSSPVLKKSKNHDKTLTRLDFIEFLTV